MWMARVLEETVGESRIERAIWTGENVFKCSRSVDWLCNCCVGYFNEKYNSELTKRDGDKSDGQGTIKSTGNCKKWGFFAIRGREAVKCKEQENFDVFLLLSGKYSKVFVQLMPRWLKTDVRTEAILRTYRGTVWPDESKVQRAICFKDNEHNVNGKVYCP